MIQTVLGVSLFFSDYIILEIRTFKQEVGNPRLLELELVVQHIILYSQAPRPLQSHVSIEPCILAHVSIAMEPCSYLQCTHQYMYLQPTSAGGGLTSA